MLLIVFVQDFGALIELDLCAVFSQECHIIQPLGLLGLLADLLELLELGFFLYVHTGLLLKLLTTNLNKMQLL